MRFFAMTINGVSVDAAETFDVKNPATGEVIAAAPNCSAKQLEAAVAAAAGAFGDWRRDEGARRLALRDIAEGLAAATDEFAELLTREQGKPLAEARGEVLGAQTWFRYFAELEIPRQVLQDDKRAFVEVVRRPLGPVAAVMPWNYPLLLASWKLAPALLAGNTVVAKPSPYTPLSTLRLGEIMGAILPAGVANVVAGLDPLGALLVEHPAIRKVSFTGSVATGRRVGRAAVDDLKRMTLELGGNDAAIVLDDIDMEAVGDRLMWGAFMNCGQVCAAIKRLYVPESRYERVLNALTTRVRALQVGDGLSEDVQIGPINNERQLERVSGLVSDSVARGGRVLVGGRRIEGPGYFYEPTVLADVTEGMRIVDEEQFGPALPVIAYRSEEEAIARANESAFGLGGSVWSADPDRAAALAAELECGTVWINDHAALAPHQPFGGVKWSGLGVENGLWGLDAFTDLQVVRMRGSDRPAVTSS